MTLPQEVLILIRILQGLKDCIKAWTSVSRVDPFAILSDDMITGVTGLKVHGVADDIWRRNLPQYTYDIQSAAALDYVNANDLTGQKGIKYTPDAEYASLESVPMMVQS